MKISLRLSDHDRQRLGCPEWIGVEVMSITAREAAAIQRGVELPETGQRVGFSSPQVWLKALLGREVVDDRGEPVMVDVEADGGTVRRPMREPDFGAELILTWLALRRAGITVPLAELDFDILNRDWRIDQDGDGEDGEQGKDPEPAESTPPMMSS